jgi:hypothetical protein
MGILARHVTRSAEGSAGDSSLVRVTRNTARGEGTVNSRSQLRGVAKGYGSIENVLSKSMLPK